MANNLQKLIKGKQLPQLRRKNYHHLKKRLKERKIPQKTIRNIFKNIEDRYFDNLRNHHIAISTVMYQKKIRKVLAAYDKIADIAEVITSHPNYR